MRVYLNNHGFTRIGSLTLPVGVGGVSRQSQKSHALAQTIHVIRGLKLVALTIIALLMGSAVAATGASPEFRLDLRSLGPWQRHVARASEPLAYSSSWATNAAEGAKAVVKVVPVLKTKPKYLVIDLSGGTSATHYPISYLDEVPGGSWSDEYKTSKLVLRHIPAGSFIMGGRATDYPGAVNTNLHMVTITRDFYMGVFEVTQRQWELVMGTRPSSFTNELCYATRPVETISRQMVRGDRSSNYNLEGEHAIGESFVSVIARCTGITGFDFPSSAQWEMACRSGRCTALNSGKNISNIDSCVEANEVARYKYNSHRQEYTFASNGKFPFDVTIGTSKVGQYLDNEYGLFDMHGNVWEWCLDGTNILETIESIDPLEGEINATTGIARGGSWCDVAATLRSGHANRVVIIDEAGRLTHKNVGFRLCLQGGDVPDFAAASTLVNESGAGSQSWTPTRSGAYYLTHSTMNGTTNVQIMSAWFEVPGCELTLEPQGELTNGVSVAITGAGEGWTVYYTTNGLVPSAASTPYTGPFSLFESSTVRAVAYNAQGVSSEETVETFTLHDALGVASAVARPRYPWNGLVDVDCEIKGDPEAKYEVELVAKDLEGGTNIEVRTVGAARRRGPQSQNNESALNDDCISTGEAAAKRSLEWCALGDRALPPGTYRLTWNADADIAYDHDFPQVAVTVKATKQSVLADYARSFAISTDGYAGEETLTGVPVLVRLSTAIDGFDYRDFASPSNGADLAFFDANEQALPYEIDEWHTNGESLVWVKLPMLAKGARFTCAYGRDSSINGRAQDIATAKHEVWREYAGVWHMNEDSGTAFDSTEHGLDALPSCGTNKLADISQMVAYENGACGRARVNATSPRLNCGNYMQMPSYSALAIGNEFTVAGWFLTEVPNGSDLLIGRMYNNSVNGHGYSSKGGWHLETRAADGLGYVVCGATNHTGYVIVECDDYATAWVNIAVVYAGTNATCYSNGKMIKKGKVVMATDNGLPMTLGCPSNGEGGSFTGRYDEIRLRGGSLSADRIKADYDMIANRAFCTYGAVKKGAKK